MGWYGGGTGVSPVQPGGDARLSTSELRLTATTIARVRNASSPAPTLLFRPKIRSLIAHGFAGRTDATGRSSTVLPLRFGIVERLRSPDLSSGGNHPRPSAHGRTLWFSSRRTSYPGRCASPGVGIRCLSSDYTLLRAAFSDPVQNVAGWLPLFRCVGAGSRRRSYRLDGP